jgi:hypothetical protein
MSESEVLKQLNAEEIATVAHGAITQKNREIDALRVENERLRSVPFMTGPDGEPNEPDLGAYVDLQQENERLREARNLVLTRTIATERPDLTYVGRGYTLHDLQEDLRAALSETGGV